MYYVKIILIFIAMTLFEDISRIREVMGLLTEETEKVDAILVGGLDYRPTDYPISKQVELLKSGLGQDKVVKGFKYNAPTSEITNFIKLHPNTPIYLFSAGASKAYEISNAEGVDKNNLYIIEPYASSSKTKEIVSRAISNGVPASNVFVGDNESRGKGVVDGTSNSGSESHWGALQKVGEMSGGKQTNTPVIDSNTENQINKEELQISYKYNPEVERLQQQLVDRGYYIGKYGRKKNGVDGIYGSFTKAAHEAFKQGITPKEFESKRSEMAQQYMGNVDDETLSNEFNFHLIPDGRNNYRSAQIPVTITQDGQEKELLAEVIKKYGIKNIIRFNGDGNDSRHRSSHPQTSIASEENLAKSLGVNFYKISSHKGYKRGEGYVSSLNEVIKIMSQGNTLVHCAHGADRTGGMVGGYLKKTGVMTDLDQLWDYTTQFNGWKRKIQNGTFFGSGYDKYADTFYPVDSLRQKYGK